MSSAARGDRITADVWHELLGAIGGGSGGGRPAAERSTNLCPRCGNARHAHQKERVTDGDGRFYYRYKCK